MRKILLMGAMALMACWPRALRGGRYRPAAGAKVVAPARQPSPRGSRRKEAASGGGGGLLRGGWRGCSSSGPWYRKMLEIDVVPGGVAVTVANVGGAA